MRYYIEENKCRGYAYAHVKFADGRDIKSEPSFKVYPQEKVSEMISAK